MPVCLVRSLARSLRWSLPVVFFFSSRFPIQSNIVARARARDLSIPQYTHTHKCIQTHGLPPTPPQDAQQPMPSPASGAGVESTPSHSTTTRTISARPLSLRFFLFSPCFTLCCSFLLFIPIFLLIFLLICSRSSPQPSFAIITQDLIQFLSVESQFSLWASVSFFHRPQKLNVSSSFSFEFDFSLHFQFNRWDFIRIISSIPAHPRPLSVRRFLSCHFSLSLYFPISSLDTHTHTPVLRPFFAHRSTLLILSPSIVTQSYFFFFFLLCVCVCVYIEMIRSRFDCTILGRVGFNFVFSPLSLTVKKCQHVHIWLQIFSPFVLLTICWSARLVDHLDSKCRHSWVSKVFGRHTSWSSISDFFQLIGLIVHKCSPSSFANNCFVSSFSVCTNATVMSMVITSVCLCVCLWKHTVVNVRVWWMWMSRKNY